MDVVYILGPGESNDELRYSLRSVAEHLPHGRVWISGYKPSWVTNVHHIPVEQVPGEKHPNSIANQRAALNHPDVSDPCLFFNDDHFVMHKLDEFPVLNWGYVEDVIRNNPLMGNTFKKSMKATLHHLQRAGVEKPVSYQLHVPLLVHKQAFLGLMDSTDGLYPEGTWIQHATIYGNLYHLGGETLPDDVKVSSPYSKEQPWWNQVPFLSTLDVAFNKGHVGWFLKRRFPRPCRYEAQ